MSGCIHKISLKELYNQCQVLNRQYEQTRNRYYLYKANILNHKYLEMGGHRLTGVPTVKYISKMMDLRNIYNKEKFTNKQRFSTIDETFRYIVYVFWKNAEKGNTNMYKPKTMINTLSNGYSVEIVYHTLLDDHLIVHEINEGVIRNKDGVDITVLLVRLLEETHTILGGTEASFQLIQNILAEYGEGLLDTNKVWRY